MSPSTPGGLSVRIMGDLPGRAVIEQLTIKLGGLMKPRREGYNVVWSIKIIAFLDSWAHIVESISNIHRD